MGPSLKMSHPFPVMTTGAFAIYHATTETQAKPIRCARPTVGPPAGTPVSTEVNQGVNAEVTWPVCSLHNVNYPPHFSMKDKFSDSILFNSINFSKYFSLTHFRVFSITWASKLSAYSSSSQYVKELTTQNSNIWEGT